MARHLAELQHALHASYQAPMQVAGYQQDAVKHARAVIGCTGLGAHRIPACLAASQAFACVLCAQQCPQASPFELAAMCRARLL